jgi:hypothetical protein
MWSRSTVHDFVRDECVLPDWSIWFTGFSAVLGFGHGIAVSMEFGLHEGSYFYLRLALCIVSVITLTF